MKIRKDLCFSSQAELYCLDCSTLTYFHFAYFHFFVDVLCCLGAFFSVFFCLFTCFFLDQQMLSSNPQIYSCSLPDTFQADLPNLQKLCAGSRLPSGPLRRLSKLQSARGEAFLHFAKSHFFVDGKWKCCYLSCAQASSGQSVYPLTVFSLRGRKEFQLQKWISRAGNGLLSFCQPHKVKSYLVSQMFYNAH